MNEFMIRDKIDIINKRMKQNEIDKLAKDNQDLQDFMLWMIGFLDGNISKRGEGKQ